MLENFTKIMSFDRLMFLLKFQRIIIIIIIIIIGPPPDTVPFLSPRDFLGQTRPTAAALPLGPISRACMLPASRSTRLASLLRQVASEGPVWDKFSWTRFYWKLVS
jgi:hypothetical protein